MVQCSVTDHTYLVLGLSSSVLNYQGVWIINSQIYGILLYIQTYIYIYIYKHTHTHTLQTLPRTVWYLCMCEIDILLSVITRLSIYTESDAAPDSTTEGNFLIS
jgi:hypothetical protein